MVGFVKAVQVNLNFDTCQTASNVRGRGRQEREDKDIDRERERGQILGRPTLEETTGWLSQA